MPSTTTVLVLLGTLLAAGNAVPFPRDLPRCSKECPLAGSQKLWYSPEKTYTYHYSTTSKVHLKDVEGSDSQMHWSSTVDLTWLTPCDMAITFREPSFEGATGTHEARSLSRYPVVVAMNDGRVEHICAHPDDKPWAINLKKGVATALQNSLPSTSSVNSGLRFSEADLMGTCPTEYEVENMGRRVLIRKSKNPQLCSGSSSDQRDSPMSWIKSPSEVLESSSKCTQDMSEGIYTSITCEDRNIIKSSADSRRYIEAVQKSELKYQSESSEAPQALSELRGPLVQRGLHHEYEALERDLSRVPELEEVLRKICSQTSKSVDKDVAELIAKAIKLVRHISEDGLEQILQKIKNGDICSNFHKLESLFLDALAAVHEANSVNLMVKEIMNERSCGGRSFLYTLALHYIHNPTIRAVEAVKPLMEHPHKYRMASLAAASLVSKYCKNHHRCQDNIHVQEVLEALNRNWHQHCSSAASEAGCLATLKSYGNLGVMRSEDARRMGDLIGKEGVSEAVQVATAQSFRNAKCENMPTGHLVDIATDPRKHTEARINSYLTVERCAEMADWKRMSDRLFKEENTQARGFILSHMHNLKRTSDPHKERQRSMLSSITVPRDFSSDYRKYSGNMDLSYRRHQFGSSMGMESNVIYTPGSFVPRSVHVNLTDSSGVNSHNYGEFGIRAEGLDTKVRHMFGPEGYLKRSSMDQMLMDASEFIRQKGSSFMEYMQEAHGRRGHIDLSEVTKFITDLFSHHSDKEPRMDLFARRRGHEMAFMTLTKRSLEEAGISSLLEAVLDTLYRTATSNIDAARTMHMGHERTLLTSQGIPFKIRRSGTLVAGLVLDHMSDSSESDSLRRKNFNPSFSGLIQHYSGFESLMGSCGIHRNTKISSINSLSLKHKGGQRFEYEFDIPEKMELLDISSRASRTKHIRGHPMTEESLFEMRTPEDRRHRCFQNLEEMMGLKVCYDENIMDAFRGNDFSSDWSGAGKITAEKSDRSMRGWRVKGEVQNNPEASRVSFDMETPGSSTPRHVNCLLDYARDSNSWKMDAGMSSARSGGYKMELRRRYSDSENRMEFKVHSSHNEHFTPETEVFEALFSSQYDGRKSEVHARSQTKNALKPFLDHYFEVQGDMSYHPRSGLPILRRLQKFNTRTICGDSRLVSSIERTGEREYTSLLKVGSRTRDLFDMEAKHSLEGSWDEGMTARTNAAVRMRDQQYKTALYIHNRPEKRGISLNINRLGDSSKVLECEVLFEHSDRSRKARMQLDIPEHMRAIKFEGQMEDHGSNRYHIQAALKHGRNDVFHIEGPITARSTYDMKHFETDLSVRTMPDNRGKMSTILIWGDSKQHVLFDMRGHHEPIFAFEWKKSSEEGEETNGAMKLLLPGYIDHNIDVKSSSRNIMMKLDTAFSQNTPYSRRIKASTDVNFDDMKGKAELYWDADRDQNKKMSIEATAVREFPNHATIHGQGSLSGNTYYYTAEFKRSDSDSWLYGQKHVNFEVTTPSSRRHRFETALEVEPQSEGAKLKAEVAYKDPEEKVHKFRQTMDLKRDWRSSNFRVHSKTEFAYPDGRESSLGFEARHERNSEEREALVQLRVKNPSMSEPFQTTFNLKHQHGSYKGEWKIDTDTPSYVSHYEMSFSPSNRVKTLKAGFDMKKINAILKAARNMGKTRRESEGMMEENKYLIHYENPRESSHKILLRSPSREMEGEFSHSPSEYLLRFNPDKSSRNPIYELSFSSHRNSGLGENQVRYNVRFSHPKLERSREAEVVYSSHDERRRGTGTVMLDIFPRAEDRITGTVEATRTARDAMRIEAKLSGRMLKNDPRIIVNTAYSHNTMGVDFLYEKSSGSKPFLSLSGKYDRRSGRHAAMSFIVKTEEEPILEISGSSRPEQSSSCNGREITAVMKSSKMGRYDILSKVCGKSFVSAEVRREGSGKSYMYRGGAQDMRTLELSAWVRNDETREVKPIALAQIKLKSPTSMDIELNYQNDEAEHLCESARKNWPAISAAIRSSMEKMYKEAINEEMPFSDSDLVKLWDAERNRIDRMIASLPISDMPSCSHLKDLNLNRRMSEMLKSQQILDLFTKYDHYRRRLNSGMVDLMEYIRQKYEILASYVNRDVLNRGRHTLAFLLDISSRMAENWGVRFPEEYEALKKIVEKLKEEIDRMQREGHVTLKHMSDEDVLRIWHQISSADVAYQTGGESRRARYLSIHMKPNHIKAEVPLYQPVSSLAEASRHMVLRPSLVPESVLISYDYLVLPLVDLWTKSHRFETSKILSGFLPPFKKTAMVVDGTEVLTFDGSVIRAPPSNCKVLLASYKGNSIHMTNLPVPTLPHIFMHTREGNIEILNDGTLLFEGTVVKGPHFSHGELEIFRNYHIIAIKLPTLVFRLDMNTRQATVDVDAWSYGQVSGLMGNNDGEKANDWNTRSGHRASSLQELVNSWQEDQGCRTPAVEPMNASNVSPLKALQCNVLLGAHVPCHPEVRPESFMKICHGSRNACHAAKAYQSLCYKMGSRELALPVTC